MTRTVLDDASVPPTRIESCDGVACELLVDPISRPEPEPFTVTTRPAEPRVVLQDNGKPTSMTILREAEAILRSRGVEVSVTVMPKESAGRPLEPQQLGMLDQERGLLLMGVND